MDLGEINAVIIRFSTNFLERALWFEANRLGSGYRGNRRMVGGAKAETASVSKFGI